MNTKISGESVTLNTANTYCTEDITVAIDNDIKKEAETYTPTTTNQNIAAGQFLAGVQTILGDPNLVSENIVSGVSIFGVNGSAITSGYESVLVEGITTLAELTVFVDEINTAGRHVFFDFHNFISGAYVCLVQKYTEASVDYLYIFDLLNRHIYGSLNGYTGTDTIANYIAASGNNNDLPYILKITDASTTIADVISKIDRVNALGQHVFIDVSALNTSDYLVTFTYNTGETITACKAIGLVKGVEAYRGYATAELSTTLFSTFLSTAGDLSAYFEGTYAELKSLKDNALLIPGAKYRLTDYDLVLGTSASYDCTSFHHLFDLVLTAATTMQFEADCFAEHHAGDTYFASSDLSTWHLKYQFDNIDTYHSWCSTAAEGRGVIFDMLDEYGNHCSWDFKNLGLSRSTFYSFSGHTSLSSGNDYIYTFGLTSDLSITGSAYGNNILEVGTKYLPKIVFGVSTRNCDFKYRQTDASRAYAYFYNPNGAVYDIDLNCGDLRYSVFDYAQQCSGTLTYVIDNKFTAFYGCAFDNAKFQYGSGIWAMNCKFGECEYNLYSVDIRYLEFRGMSGNILLRNFSWNSSGIYTGTISLIVSNTGSDTYSHHIMEGYAYNSTVLKRKKLSTIGSGNTTITDLYADVNILSSPSEWHSLVRAGTCSPAITLPTPNQSAEETFKYIFTAASTSATFTAPAQYVLTDTTFTGKNLRGNTITFNSLVVNHIYIAKFLVVSDHLIAMDLEDWGADSSYNVGDVVSINLDGTAKNHRVLEVNSNILKVVTMYSVGTSAFDASTSRAYYTDSSLEYYLNVTYYNTLIDEAKAALVYKDLDCSMWSQTFGYDYSLYQSGSYTSVRYGKINNKSLTLSRKIAPISMGEFFAYLGLSSDPSHHIDVEKMNAVLGTTDQNIWFRNTGYDSGEGKNNAFAFSASTLRCPQVEKTNVYQVYPVLNIDASKITVTKV